jgi:lipopolysaccharide export system permease protein
MLPVVDRYFVRQLLLALLAVSLVLLFIFVSNRLVHYLADAAAGQLPAGVIFELLGLKALKYLILLLPLALYLAILLVLGRMYKDSEMAALASCGVGPTRLYRPVMWVAVPMALMQGWLSLHVVPWSDRFETRLVARAESRINISAVTPGRFHEGHEGQRVIYVERITGNDQLHNVFIHLRHHDHIVLLSAKRGYIETDKDNGYRYLVLVDGNRYEGLPGSGKFRILHFAKHGLLLRGVPVTVAPPRLNELPTAQLWGSSDPRKAAELQWRISVPLAAVVLGLLAVPVGRVSPRKGTYGKLLVAVLLYVFYFNILALARTWMEKGETPLVLGLWWVHGSVLLLAAAWLIRQHGPAWVWMRFKQRLRGRRAHAEGRR